MYPSIFMRYVLNDLSSESLIRDIRNSKTLSHRDGLATLYNVSQQKKNDEVKSFVVSDSLADALHKVDCEEVGPWHLKGTQAYHFLFKKNYLTDGKYFYNEMCIEILEPSSGLFLHRNSSATDHKICIYMCDSTKEYSEGIPATYTGSRFKAGSTIDQITSIAVETDLDMSFPVAKDLSVKTLRLALNLILYVNSKDPDIMRLKPQIYNTKSFRENYFPKCKDSALYGIYSLGWDYHGREYSVAMSTRKGHPRWQACGKLWSERRLIFVEPTTVNYNKRDSDDVT